MFHVSATYNGAETGNPLFDLTWTIVGSQGNTFDDYCGVIPDSFNDQGELFGGTTAEGNVCVSVADDQIEGDTVQVAKFLGDGVFVGLV